MTCLGGASCARRELAPRGGVFVGGKQKMVFAEDAHGSPQGTDAKENDHAVRRDRKAFYCVCLDDAKPACQYGFFPAGFNGFCPGFSMSKTTDKDGLVAGVGRKQTGRDLIRQWQGITVDFGTRGAPLKRCHGNGGVLLGRQIGE